MKRKEDKGNEGKAATIAIIALCVVLLFARIAISMFCQALNDIF